MMPKTDKSAQDRGFIALMTVIVIGAIILTIGATASFLGQTDLIVAGHVDRGYSTRAAAVSCAEEALQRLKLDAAYVGGTVPIDGSSCAVSVCSVGAGTCTAISGGASCSVSVPGGGSSKTIVAAATIDIYTKCVAADASLKQNTAATAGAFSINSWQEIDPP